MEKVLIDENGDYGLDYTNAVWASDKMHQDYHNAKVQLSDADFLIENHAFVMIVEYKNANTEKAMKKRWKTKPFNPMEDKKFASTVRKFYDSRHYLALLGKKKPVRYIYVVEVPNGDVVMRKRLRERMKTQLPFALQDNLNTGIKLIDKVDVMSINEWNADREYGKYPFIKLEQKKREEKENSVNL